MQKELLEFVANKVRGHIVDDEIFLGGLEPDNTMKTYNLDSWELFGKGLEIFYTEYKCAWVSIDQLISSKCSFKIDRLPLEFWRSWYCIEK